MYRVMDRNGRLVEVEDGRPVPDGCRLAVDAMFLDGLNAMQRQVFADSQHEDDVEDEAEDEADDEVEDEADAEAAGISQQDADRISDWLRRSRRGVHADTEALRRTADAAWWQARERLGRRNKRYSQISSDSAPPSAPPKPLQSFDMRALQDRAAAAYDKRSVDLSNRWRKNKGAVANATPVSATSAAWVK